MECFDGLAILAAVPAHEVVRQENCVTGSFAQRRKVNRYDIETEPKIFAERPGADHGLKVHIGRRDHPYICVNDLLASNWTEAVVLKEP